MNSSIKVLMNVIQDHRKEIERLENIEPEMQAEIMFIDEEIKNHKQEICIHQNSIEILLRS